MKLGGDRLIQEGVAALNAYLRLVESRNAPRPVFRMVVTAVGDYAVPLKFTDVMVFSKGGFLVGNYGTEEAIAPWMQNFRALPAIVFSDMESPSPEVTIRKGSADGADYLYIVNTTPTKQRVRVAALAGYREIVSGHTASCDVALAPYELKSYIRQSSHR